MSIKRNTFLSTRKCWLFAGMLFLMVCQPAVIKAEETTLEWGKQMRKHLQYSRNFWGKDRPKLEEIHQDIQRRLDTDPNNPVLWILRGRVDDLLLSIHARKIRHLPKEEYFNDPEFKSLKEKSHSAYQKALDLDAREDAPMRLTIYMLGFISDDVLAPADLKVAADRRVIDEGLTPDESYSRFEYVMHASMSSAYLNEDRYDEALAVMDEMLEKFPRRAEETLKTRAIIEEHKKVAERDKHPVETQVASTEQKHHTEHKPDIKTEKKDIQPPPHQQEVVTKTTKAPVQEKGKPKPAVTATHEPKPPITEHGDNTLLYVLLAIGGVIIFFAGVLALRKRKEKT